jgi:hypothetical protein
MSRQCGKFHASLFQRQTGKFGQASPNMIAPAMAG